MNIKFQTQIVVTALALAIASSACRQASAQEKAAAVDHAAVLAPFLSDDSVVVSFTDLAAIDPPGLVSTIVPILNLPPPDRQQADQMAAAVKGVLDNLRAAGVRRIYVVWGVGDALTGPLVVIPLANAGRDVEAREKIQALASLFQVLGPRSGIPPLRIQRHASGALIMGSDQAVDCYGLLVSQERADLLTPLARMTNDGAAAAAVVSPGPDTRRVIRELWPPLSPPLAALSGPLLADRLRHVEVAVKLTPDLAGYIAIDTADAESAATFQQFVAAARAFVAQIRDRKTAELMGVVASALDVRTEGSRLVVKLPTDKGQLATFGTVVSNALDAARESAHRNVRMSNVKQFGIAFANYEASRKAGLPPAAIRDVDGRPLLSWRVAILPYIEQKALYAQFHLNEPWDSPHNRELITKMPDMYADPDPKFAQLARAGKTMFQVPVGPQTVFFKNEGTKYLEIIDGTFSTILIVEVVPERAVEWTKPADWEVDMAKPLDGVRRIDRNGFAAGFADAHAQFISNDIDPVMFRAMLTRAGQEVVNPSP